MPIYVIALDNRPQVWQFSLKKYIITTIIDCNIYEVVPEIGRDGVAKENSPGLSGIGIISLIR